MSGNPTVHELGYPTILESAKPTLTASSAQRTLVKEETNSLVQSTKQAVLSAAREAAEQLVQVPGNCPGAFLDHFTVVLSDPRQHLCLEAIRMPLAQVVLDALLR